jgi:chitin disaccharide deacetylase
VPAHRVLVVNADDLGLSDGVNRGIVEAHEHGIVTSATLMVRAPAAAAAAGVARGHPGLSVGLHLDLGEWVYAGGEWRLRYQVVDPDDDAAVAAEVDRQLDAFTDLLGHPPTHLDSHQHVHRSGPARRALTAAGERLGVPVREVTPGIAYLGAFYGQSGKGHPVPEAITVEALVALIRALPAGVTELGCHPGRGELDSVYATERVTEVATLCSPVVRAALDDEGVELRSFADLAGGPVPAG